MEAAGMEATTADGAIGTQDITDGTVAGDGGAAVTIRGGCFSRQSFQFRFLTLTMADTDMGRDTATVLGTVMEGDTERVISSLRYGVLRSPWIAGQYSG
jgi:hypothetical protein